MFKGKMRKDFTNLLSPHSFENIDKVILDYFWKKCEGMSEVQVCDIKNLSSIR